MPRLSEDQIQAMVDRDAVRAITLDTTVFDQYGCNLLYRSLAALAQFKGTNVTVLLTPVTIGEVTAHIARDAAAAAEKATSAINQFLKAWSSDRDRAAIAADLGTHCDARAHATQMVATYIETIGALRVPVEGIVSVDALLERYFAATAPFSAKREKKAEFPDAIALLALEAWAEVNQCHVIAISKDDDWARYAEQSPRIICVPNLASGINFFNREASVIALRLSALLDQGQAGNLMKAIEAAIEEFIQDFSIDADADYFFEQEEGPASLIGITIENGPPAVLASDAEEVTVAFMVKADAQFLANFSFSTRDGVDRDHIPLGSVKAMVEETFSTQVVVTVSKDGIEGNPVPTEAQAEGRSLSIDFGYVSPDWGDEG